jgi:hypothetical protein
VDERKRRLTNGPDGKHRGKQTPTSSGQAGLARYAGRSHAEWATLKLSLAKCPRLRRGPETKLRGE